MKTMPVRIFLRGGYKDLTELTLITHHGRPIATWMPQQDAKARRKDERVAYTTVINEHHE